MDVLRRIRAHTTINRLRAHRFGIVVAIALLLDGSAAAATLAVARADIAPAPAAGTTANAGPKNIVQVQNSTDGQLIVRSRMQLGRVPAPQVGPVNIAEAVNTCSQGCDTLAVALQINMVNSDAAVFTPQNAAVAVNAACTGCHAVALAIQYNIGSEDPIRVQPEVDRFVASMKQELAHIDSSATSLSDAENEVEGVLAQYQDLVVYLSVQRNESTTPPAAPPAAAPAAAPPADSPAPATSAPAPQPSPIPTSSPSASPSSEPSASPSP